MTHGEGDGRFALGTWGLAGSSTADAPGYGDVSAEDAAGVLDAVAAAGVDWIDTAMAYGEEALRRVARWQESVPNPCRIAVKVGRPTRDGRPTPDLRIESIVTELDAVEQIVGQASAILLKDPPESAIADGIVEATLTELGRVRPRAHVGLSTHVTRPALPPTPTCRIAMIELNGVNWFSSCRTAHQLDTGGWEVWAMQPLAYGYLGRRRATDEFPSHDWRHRLSLAQRRALQQRAAAFVHRLQLRFPNESAPRLSVAFCLAQRSVRRVVIGPKTAEQARVSLSALDLSRQADFVDAVNSLVRTISLAE